MRELGESSYLKSDRAKTCVQLIYEKCVGQQIEFDCIGHESIDNRLYFNMQCSINGTVSMRIASNRELPSPVARGPRLLLLYTSQLYGVTFSYIQIHSLLVTCTNTHQ